MGKVLLFYKYINIKYPKRLVKWQKQICNNLSLKGRILIGKEGINGTVGGSDCNISHYKTIMHKNELFADMEFKESEGGSTCFPKMRIVCRDEIVTLGLSVDDISTGGGKHLKPQETHNLIASKPKDLVMVDVRNDYEWKVGRFTGALLVNPKTKTFKEFPEFIDKNIDTFKDKQVLMYCTGGVRCERASTYLQKKGIAKKIYQMDGGIHKYVEQFPNGYFRGKNYVFDGRVTVKVNEDILGKCEICTISCDDYINCLNVQCNKHFICCVDCKKKLTNTCSKQCQELLVHNKVKSRPEFKKYRKINNEQ